MRIMKTVLTAVIALGFLVVSCERDDRIIIKLATPGVRPIR